MRFKITILLLLANLATFGLIWKLERDRDAPQVLPAPLFPAAIREISITGPGVPHPYTLEKHQYGWRIISPFAWEANIARVSPILEQLQFIQMDGSFTVAEAEANGSTRADYGLEKPQVRITVKGDAGEPVIIQLGRPVAESASGPVYLLSPDERIIPVSQQLLANLNVTPESLRADTIFNIGSFEVRNITVRIATGETAEQHIRIKRDQRQIPDSVDTERVWRFETPITADANRLLVEKQVEQLTQLRYQRFLPVSPELSPELLGQSGLTTPAMRLTLEGNNRSQTLLIGAVDTEAPARAPAYFAKLEDNRAVFTVSKAEIDGWREAQTALREREFFHFYPSQLTEVTLHADNGTLVFHRRPASAPSEGASPPAPETDWGDWTIPVLPGTTATVTQAADAGIMRHLIESIRHLAAQEAFVSGDLPDAQRYLCRAFVTDAPTEAQLAALGFDKPVRRVELSFRTSPRDGSRPAQIARRTLLIAAPVTEGTPYHAKIADQPSVYSIRPEILEVLSVSPVQYRNRVVEQLAADVEIVGLKITDLATGKILLEAHRPAPATSWEVALSSRPADERTQVNQLLEQLRTVRAEKFVDSAFNRGFTTLHLGARNAEGWRYQLDVAIRSPGATADEARTFFFTKRLGGTSQVAGSPTHNCIFYLEQPLIDALFPLTFGRDNTVDIPEIQPPVDLPPPPENK